ncbi:hypothetical protein CRYUN_Cryun25bG0087700 [Craigia yunnanensis]
MHNNSVIKEEKNNERVLNKEKWCAPEVGWVKINCDGAFGPVDKKTGTRVVIRDSEGRTMDGACCRFLADCALQAEAMAVKKGVSLTIEKRWKRVIVEIDSSELFLVLTNKCSMID